MRPELTGKVKTKRLTARLLVVTLDYGQRHIKAGNLRHNKLL